MNQRHTAIHPKAIAAREMIEVLQGDFVARLSRHGEALTEQFKPFVPAEWLRGEGKNGGGVRYVAEDTLFNRASINMSQVFYEHHAEKPLNSATALSTIIHPAHAGAPSFHMHLSWTHLKTDQAYWRIMADLNPSNPDENDRQTFASALRDASGSLYESAAEQGDRYFYIPALKRHRGISHFYLEQYNSGVWQTDCNLAQRFGQAAISTYCDIFLNSQQTQRYPDAEQQQNQLNYHTLYFLQVLSLDRGTTSGLLVHSNNDIGILGSLPRYINRDLLSSWLTQVPEPQPELLRAILNVLPVENAVEINDAIKQQLADVVRAFYQSNPKALELQARGDVVPPTISNHGASVK